MTLRFLPTAIAAAAVAAFSVPALADQSASDSASYFIGEAAAPEVEARAIQASATSNTHRTPHGTW